MPQKPRHTDALAGLRDLLTWIAETTQASRLARLSSLGLDLPRHADPGRECWRDDMARPSAGGTDTPPG